MNPDPDREYFRRIRDKVGHDILLLPATACIVLNEHDEVLMQCRTDNDMWSCPGGILDLGESVMENAVREVFEETGLRLGSVDLFGVFAGPDFYFTYPNGDQTAIVQFVFIARESFGELAPDAESQELRWFPVGALPSPITGTHAGFLRLLPEVLGGTRQMPVII